MARTTIPVTTQKKKLTWGDKLYVLVSLVSAIYFAYLTITTYMNDGVILWYALIFCVGSLAALFFLVFKHNSNAADEADSIGTIAGLVGLFAQ